jgi:hypothetical protein
MIIPEEKNLEKKKKLKMKLFQANKVFSEFFKFLIEDVNEQAKPKRFHCVSKTLISIRMLQIFIKFVK